MQKNDSVNDNKSECSFYFKDFETTFKERLKNHEKISNIAYIKILANFQNFQNFSLSPKQKITANAT